VPEREAWQHLLLSWLRSHPELLVLLAWSRGAAVAACAVSLLPAATRAAWLFPVVWGRGAVKGSGTRVGAGCLCPGVPRGAVAGSAPPSRVLSAVGSDAGVSGLPLLLTSL